MRKVRVKALGEKIKYFRKQRKLTQVELAVIIGISTGYIGSIEQGLRSPSLRTLRQIVKALKINASELLTF